MPGIVFGCIVPHPPLLVPEIGRGQEAAISATTRAMNRLTEELAQSRPQALFLISPHGRYHHDAMGVATAPSLQGDFVVWGVRGLNFRFDNDTEVMALLQQEAQAADVPLRSIGERSYELDWGVLVPMYFLARGVPGVPLVPLTYSWLSLETHFAFGKALARAAERSGKRVAVIASGDLSHRLIPSAPAGYDPMGKVFDERLAELVRSGDAQGIMRLDPELVERAGECGYRSIIILLGALDGLKTAPVVHSYEGPFGVGYLVASIPVVGEGISQEHPLVNLARQTVENHIREGRRPNPPTLTAEMRERAGVFVSIKKQGQLRGCIGTYEPARANVAEEVVANAVASATRDPRFAPIEADELPYLSYSVDILTPPEPIAGPEQLDPRRYGVIVESGLRHAILLPDLEGVDTVEQQLNICRAKALIGPDEPLKLYRFEVRRYT